MKTKQITKYVCEICGEEYDEPQQALNCESRPVTEDKGVKVDDIHSEWQQGDECWYLELTAKEGEDIIARGIVMFNGKEGESYLRKSYKRGIVFHTQQEAQEELDYRLAEAELKRIAKRLNGDEESLGYYCFIYWSRERNEACVSSYMGTEDILNVIEFANEKLAEQAIAEMGEQRLKNYFRVK